MAKPKSTTRLSGKVGDQVHVDGKYGPVVRSVPKDGISTQSERSRAQNVRTGYLNLLAGDLNRIIWKYARTLKSSDFYHLLHKRFRREKLDNRFLLLKNLEGMEVNSSYPLDRLGKSRVTVTKRGGQIIVSQDVIYHPSASVRGHKADCYYYQVLLLVWTEDAASALPKPKRSAWIMLDDEVPLLNYKFDCPENTTEWLVCVRQVMGADEERIEALVAEGMQIVLAGTSDKKDLALYEQRKKEAAALLEKPRRKKKEDDEDLVQPTKRKK